MGEIPLFIEDEPELEFIKGDLVKISGPTGDGRYSRVMPRSMHYAYVKKCVIAHERHMREHVGDVAALHVCTRADRDCEACEDGG